MPCNEYGSHLIFQTATRWQAHLDSFFLLILLIVYSCSDQFDHTLTASLDHASVCQMALRATSSSRLTEIKFITCSIMKFLFSVCISFVYLYVICSELYDRGNLLCISIIYTGYQDRIKACRTLPTSLVVFAALTLQIQKKS